MPDAVPADPRWDMPPLGSEECDAYLEARHQEALAARTKEQSPADSTAAVSERAGPRVRRRTRLLIATVAVVLSLVVCIATFGARDLEFLSSGGLTRALHGL